MDIETEHILLKFYIYQIWCVSRGYYNLETSYLRLF